MKAIGIDDNIKVNVTLTCNTQVVVTKWIIYGYPF